MLIFAFLMSISALAAEPELLAELPQSCSTEIKNYCENEATPKDKAKCLFANIGKLSDSCRQEVQRFGRAIEQATEQSGQNAITPSALTSMAPPFPVVALEGRYSPGKNTLKESKLNISTPIRVSKQDYLAVSLSGGQTSFDQPISLGTTEIVPAELSRVELGLQYTRQLEGFKNWGLRTSVGYAGDKLFKNSRDTAFNIVANYGYPSATGGFWNWLIFFSNNSPLGNFVPIPCVMYIYNTPTFTGMFGFPITSLQWTPIKGQAYSFSLLGLSMTTEAAFGDIMALQSFTTLKWTNQSFLLSDRALDKDRLTFEEKKAGIGIRSFLFKRMRAELEAGYAFDRILYSGDGARNMRSGAADLSSDWYAAVSIKSGF